MGNIVLLDDLTINKIAAGEVIERPASVIKEMIENSIDAGANNITVEIEKGGISYIKVTDNGKGISADDLDMAFERHATSKIRSAEDLSTVTSMGFRGEALASIAAIARVELVSKTAEQQNGYKIIVEGGHILDKSEVGCPTGTSITVTNLFYNTPVRYKFLKRDFTEAGYIEDAITRVALVHPEVAIKLINSGRTVIQTNGNGNLKTVIYSIFGKDVANGIIDVNYTYEDISITGVIGKPEIARSNRAYQMFFVNKRFIKDKSLTAATEKAYKGMLPLGKFGFLVLNIEMNPNKVDVNVHPAKLEVRFEDEGLVFKAVYHAIKDALEKTEIMSHEIVENNKKEETIVEQIFKARQAELNKNKITEEPKIEEVPEIEKSQEVLRKLQEIKQKLIQETPQLKEKIETSENLIKPENIEEPESKEIAEIVKDQEREKTEETIKAPEYEEIQEIVKTPEYEEKTEIVEEPKREEVPEVIETLESNETPQIVDEVEKNEIPETSKELEKIEEPVENVKEPEVEYKPESGYSKEFEEMYLKLFGTKPMQEQNTETKKEKENTIDDIATLGNTSVFDGIEEYQKPNYKFIGLIFGTYIIIEIDKEMYIIDQKAAHEKILYEKIKSNYYNEENKDSQLMLLPDIITLSHKQMQIAKDNIQMFRKAGFMVEEFGENTIKLTGVPEMCLELETKEILVETLDEIDSISRMAKQEIEEKFISTIACKVAEEARNAVDRADAEDLINELLALPNPFVCTNGKSTAIQMSKYDIERKFARK